MIENAVRRLEYLCIQLPPLLKELAEADFAKRPEPDKWSKKEILGHLIDSATNNHQRFVRCQFENSPVIWYDQDRWNAASHYQEMNKEQLIHFWELYNRHLAALIRLIPAENLQCTCKGRDGSRHTLAYLIRDYVAHLEHHLQQLVQYA